MAVVFVVLSPVASMLTRDATGRASLGWVVVQALATAAAFLIPQIRQIRSEQRQAKAEEREFDTRVEVELAFNDALEPVVRLLGELAQETDRDQRERRRAQAVPLVLTTTAQLTGAGPRPGVLVRARARTAGAAAAPGVAGPCRSGDDRLRPRAPRAATRPSTWSPPARSCSSRDLDGRRSPGCGALDETAAYRSLVVVAVTVGNVGPARVITLDALEPDSFDDDDVALSAPDGRPARHRDEHPR